MKENEIQMKEKAKKDLEEKLAKEKRDKEFREKMDKDRNGLFCEKYIINNDWRKEAGKALKNMSKGKILELKEDQKVNICMDFSTRLANFFICGYKDEIIKYHFPNCLSYQRIDFDYKFSFFRNEKIYVFQQNLII